MKTIALVAHDRKKAAMLDFIELHKDILRQYHLVGTKTTANQIRAIGLSVDALESGLWGGDAQIAARIIEGKVGALIFFVDPQASQPHEAHIRTLIESAIIKNIDMALNPSTAARLMLTLCSGRLLGVA